MKVILHPAAEQDVQEAAAFYEREGSPALAARFVAEFKRLATLLIEHPEIGSPRSKGRRGFPLMKQALAKQALASGLDMHAAWKAYREGGQ